MLLGKVDFDKTNSFSQAFLDYVNQKPELRSFYTQFPSGVEAFKAQAEQRNFSGETRKVTSKVLLEQYEGFDASDATLKNIELIKADNTFTITTGHQLNIFTGPLYFIYKIVTVINACKKLKEQYPQYNFVPVYWMASEDHDFDEINHFRYQGKKFTWKTEQTGAVGRFNPKSTKPIFDEIKMPDFFKEAYLKHNTLAEAVRHYVNSLFGEQGLVVIDADHRDLKRAFHPVIEEDIFKNTANDLVNATNDQLDQLGYKAQVFPRAINFFYLKDDLRSRIVKDGEQFSVLDSDISFSETALKKEIQDYPERFSPNVVLRPLYQETILPNLAYVGGPSELVYWFQLKAIFDHHTTDFPILLPRNFAGVVTNTIKSKIEKEALSLQEIFLPTEDLLKQRVKSQSQHKLELSSPLKAIKDVYDSINHQATAVDATLEKLVAAEERKAEKSLEKIEKKLLKAEKRNQQTLVDRIYAIKDSLFPNNGLQERKDNFLNFYLADPQFVNYCLASFDPFDLRFHIINVDQ